MDEPRECRPPCDAALLAAAFEAAPSPLAVLDGHGSVVLANRAARELIAGGGRIDWTTTPLPAAGGDTHLLAMGGQAAPLPMDRDPVTGLAGPATLDAELAQLLNPFTGQGAALVVLRVDGLAGMAEGSVVEVARLVRALLRPSDLVVRLDESTFAVVLAGLGPLPARAVSIRLEQAIARPHRSAAGWLRLRGRVGVAVAGPGQDPRDLIDRAQGPAAAA